MFWGRAESKELDEAGLQQLCDKIVDGKWGSGGSEADVVNAVKALGMHHNQKLQTQAVVALAVLAESDPNKRLIVAKGGLQPLMQLVHSTDSDRALYGASRLLWHLAMDDKNKLPIVSAGGLQAVTLLAGSLVSHVQYAAARIALVLAEDRELREKMVNSSVPNTLAELLCCETDSVQFVAASTINILASDYPDCEGFAQERVLGTLVDLIRVGTENCQWAACSAVRALSHNPTNRLRLTTLGVVAQLLRFVEAGPDRLRFIAILTLVTIGLTHDVVDAFVSEDKSLLEMLHKLFSHSQPNVATAAVRLVGKLVLHDAAKNAVIARIGFQPFMKLLSSPSRDLRASATIVLSALLCDDESRKHFFSSGLLDSLLDVVVNPSSQDFHVVACVTVSFALSHTLECRRAMAEKPSLLDQLNILAAQDLVSALILCDLAEGEVRQDLTPVHAFLQASDYRVPHHSNMVVWNTNTLQRIGKFANSVRPPVRVLSAWAYCHIASDPVNIDELVAVKAPEVLQKLQGVDSIVPMANQQVFFATEALRLFAAAGPLSASIGERYYQYVELADNERTTVESLLSQYGTVKTAMDSLDMKRIEFQAAAFQDQAFFPPEVNAKLGAVRRIRDRIAHGPEIAQLRAMDAKIKNTMALVETLQKLSEREPLVTQVNELRTTIEDLNAHVNKHKQLLETAKANKAAQERALGQVQKLIEDMKRSREEKQQRMLDIMAELVDLQYQMDNNPGARKELEEQRDGLLAKLKALEERVAEIDAKIKEILAKIEAQRKAKKDFEKKLAELEKARVNSDKLRGMRQQMQQSYGSELYDNSDFKALQVSMMKKAFDNLEAIRDASPQLDTVVDRAEGGDAPTTERALVGTLTRMISEVKNKMGVCDGEIQNLEDTLEALRADKARLTEEMDGLREQLAELDRQLGALMSPEELESRKAQLEAELEQLKAQIAKLDEQLVQAEERRKQEHNKLLEASAEVAGQEAALRRFSNDRKEARKSHDALTKQLGEVLDAFYTSYQAFLGQRGTVQNELIGLHQALEEWQRLFKEEEATRGAADSAVRGVFDEVKGVVQALDNANDNPIINPDRR